jgi:isopentenyl-diphosphate delta-isomerase
MASIAQLNKELIVFVDESGKPTGETGPKIASHTRNTKLHLAFSCYLFNSKGELLITKRAAGKRVWPNVWTNSVCGHLAPGESFEAAIARRLDYELGLSMIDNLTKVVSEYSYKTPPYNDIIEHEYCPIFVGTLNEQPKPNAVEVDDYRWVSWQWLLGEVAKDLTDPGVYSYWMKDQLRILAKSPHVLGLVQVS